MADLVTVEVRSRLLPTIAVGYDPAAPGAPPSAPGVGAWFLRWLRPSVTVRSPLLGEVTRAPWGAPGPTTWPLLLLLPGGLLVVAFLLWRRVRARR